MPEYSGDVITPATPSPAETPHVDTSASEKLALVIEKANREHEAGKEGKQADGKENKTETASTEKDKENNSPKEATESKTSFLGNIFDLFRHKTDAIDNPTLAAKANRFAAQQEKLKEEKIDSLVKLFVDWIPPKKDTDPLETELSWTAQEIILNAVRQKSVNISDFTERVKLEIQGISSDTVTDEKTNPVLRAHDELTTPALEMAKGFIAQEFPEAEEDGPQPEELKKERDLLSQYINKNVTEEARQNAKITDEAERLRKAKEILGSEDDLTPESKQGKAILVAHEVGSDEVGAGVGNYSIGQLKRKYEELQKAGYTRPEIQKLMDAGIVGVPPASEDDEIPGIDAERVTEEDMLRALGEEEEEEGLDQVAQQQEKRSENMKLIDELINSQRKSEKKALERIKNEFNDKDSLRDYLTNEKNAYQGLLRRVAKYRWGENPNEARIVERDNWKMQQDKAIAEILQKLDASDGLEAAKREVEEKVREQSNVLQRLFKINLSRKEQTRTLDNMDDIAKALMENNSGYWGSKAFNLENGLNNGEAGKYPLYDEKGEFQPDNFLKWVQERMLYAHSNDPDNPQIQFGAEVAIENEDLFRPLALAQMIKNYTQYFRLRDGRVLEQLKNDCLHMMWLVGENRNSDVYFRTTMPSDEKLPEIIAQFFQKNTFTKYGARSGKSTLEEMFSMSSGSSEGGKKDVKIGDAMRSAYLIYYHIMDHEKLKQLFGKDFAYFQENTMLDALRHIMPLKKDASGRDEDRGAISQERVMVYAKENYKISFEGEDSWYENGILKEGAREQFIKLMNVFSPPQREDKMINLSKELIKQAVGRRSGLIEVGSDGFMDDQKSNRFGLDFAELNASLMTYWTGAAAVNDVTVAAFNAQTKVENLVGYLKKQANPKRAGGIGNPFEVGQRKQLAVNMMLGMLTENKKTILEILEEIEKSHPQDAQGKDAEIIREVEEKVAELHFTGNSQRQYASNHILNAYKLFHPIVSGKEVRLDSFVKVDMYGRTTYDNAKMISEVQEGIIKPTRYSLDTHPMQYEKIVRERAENGTFSDVTIAEKMFSPQILKIAQDIWRREHAHKLKDEHGKPRVNFLDANGRVLRDKDDNLTEESRKILSHDDFRTAIAKATLIGKFSAMLYSHSIKDNRKTIYDYFEYSTRESVLSALGTIPADIDVNMGDFTKNKITGRYFTKEDIKLIRKLSGNQLWKNFSIAAVKDISGGIFDGFTKFIKGYFKAVSS